jgi:uncharacterized protein YbcI
VADLEPTAPASIAPLRGGKLLAAISERIVAILRDHYGRGPTRAKTYAIDDILVVVLRGSGFTALERTIMDGGRPDRVIAMRQYFHSVMAERFTEEIERLTGVEVVAFLSQASVRPDLTLEIFLLDRPVEGLTAAGAPPEAD